MNVKRCSSHERGAGEAECAALFRPSSECDSPRESRSVFSEEAMAEGLLQGIGACVVDAYGTLFDFASAAAGCPDLRGDRAETLTALWRDKQLQYSWLRAVQGR